MTDYTFVADERRLVLVAHHPACPKVGRARAAGVMMVTMTGVRAPLERLRDIKVDRCPCLEEMEIREDEEKPS